MRSWVFLSVAWISGCAAGTVESNDKENDSSSAADSVGTGADAGPTGADGDTGSSAGNAGPPAFIPDEGRYETVEFRLKEDSCGINDFAPVVSLMPSYFGVTSAADDDQFMLGSVEQGTETGCAASALDPESGLADFTCETFREGYRSPYGNGFDMEVSFSGEITEDQMVAGELTVVLHCMVGGACDEFARNGVPFPCTIGGDLVLQSPAQD